MSEELDKITNTLRVLWRYADKHASERAEIDSDIEALLKPVRTQLAIRDKALGWQTIDSAPRDGSSFLAYIKHGDCWHIVIAGFAKNGILFDTNGDSCVGWDPCGKFGREEANRPKWQPLPELPAQALSPNTTEGEDG